MKAVLVTLLVAIILFLIFRNSTYIKDQPTIITKIDTVYQEKTFTRYKKGDSIPYIVISENIRIDTIRDTIKLINDYLSVKVYTDTITIDSSKFTIIDTLSQNMIQGRRFLAYIKERTVTITNNIQEKNKNSLYLGILGDLRRFDNKLGIGVGLTFKTAKSDLFTFGATTNEFTVGYHKKIF